MIQFPGRNDASRRGGGEARRSCDLSRAEEAAADQLTFPEPIAAGVEAVGPPRDLEFKDPLTLHPLAASAAGITHAVAAEDSLGALAWQGARVELLANPVDQPGLLGAHQRPLSLTLENS